MPAVNGEGYHATTGRSVTNFTVIRSLLLLRVRAAEGGPQRHLVQRSDPVAIGGKEDMSSPLQNRSFMPLADIEAHLRPVHPACMRFMPHTEGAAMC